MEDRLTLEMLDYLKEIRNHLEYQSRMQRDNISADKVRERVKNVQGDINEAQKKKDLSPEELLKIKQEENIAALKNALSSFPLIKEFGETVKVLAGVKDTVGMTTTLVKGIFGKGKDKGKDKEKKDSENIEEINKGIESLNETTSESARDQMLKDRGPQPIESLVEKVDSLFNFMTGQPESQVEEKIEKTHDILEKLIDVIKIQGLIRLLTTLFSPLISGLGGLASLAGGGIAGALSLLTQGAKSAAGALGKTAAAGAAFWAGWEIGTWLNSLIDEAFGEEGGLGKWVYDKLNKKDEEEVDVGRDRYLEEKRRVADLGGYENLSQKEKLEHRMNLAKIANEIKLDGADESTINLVERIRADYGGMAERDRLSSINVQPQVDVKPEIERPEPLMEPIQNMASPEKTVLMTNQRVEELKQTKTTTTETGSKQAVVQTDNRTYNTTKMPIKSGDDEAYRFGIKPKGYPE